MQSLPTERTPIIANPIQELEAWTGDCAGLWRVTAPNGLFLRATPGGDKITLLKQFTVLHVWCKSGQWYCVQTTEVAGWQTGWSHGDWLEPHPAVRALPTTAQAAAAWQCADKLRVA